MNLKKPLPVATFFLLFLSGCARENISAIQEPQTRQTQNSQAESQQMTREAVELASYTNKDLGIKFSYPKSWGEAKIEHLTFDPDCTEKKTAPNIDVINISMGPLQIEGATKDTCTQINNENMAAAYTVYKDQADFEQSIASYQNSTEAKIIDWRKQKIAIRPFVADGISYEKGYCTVCEIFTSVYNPSSKYGSIRLSFSTPENYEGDVVNLSESTPAAVQKEMQTFYDLIDSLEFTE